MVQPQSIIPKIGNKFYYALSFSDHIYVLDEKLQIKKEIRPKVLSEVNKGKNGSDFLLETPRQFYDRSCYQFKNYLGNLYLSNLQVIDELLIVQFQKPLLEKEFLPKFPLQGHNLTGEKWMGLAKIEINIG